MAAPTKAEYDEAKHHQADHYDEWKSAEPSQKVLDYAAIINAYEATEQ